MVYCTKEYKNLMGWKKAKKGEILKKYKNLLGWKKAEKDDILKKRQ